MLQCSQWTILLGHWLFRRSSMSLRIGISPHSFLQTSYTYWHCSSWLFRPLVHPSTHSLFDRRLLDQVSVSSKRCRDKLLMNLIVFYMQTGQEKGRPSPHLSRQIVQKGLPHSVCIGSLNTRWQIEQRNLSWSVAINRESNPPVWVASSTKTRDSLCSRVGWTIWFMQAPCRQEAGSRIARLREHDVHSCYGLL